MREVIAALEARIPDYNVRSFGFSDFLNISQQEGIITREWPFVFPVKGIYVEVHGQKVIGLAANLTEPDRSLVAFQELGHHFLDHGNGFTLV